MFSMAAYDDMITARQAREARLALTQAALAAAPDDLSGAVNVQTGTAYTLTHADVKKIVRLANAGAITVTVPPATFNPGDRIEVVQYGAGQVTVAPGSGVTVRATPTAKTRAQYALIEIVALSATEVVVFGDVAAS